jgi:hypothetical protein
MTMRSAIHDHWSASCVNNEREQEETTNPSPFRGDLVDESPGMVVGDKNKAVVATGGSSVRRHQQQQEEASLASSSTTTSFSDDFVVDMEMTDEDREGEKHRLADLFRLWQEHNSKTNHGGDDDDDDVVMPYRGHRERGRMIIEAFYDSPQLVTDNEYCQQLAIQQRTIEAKEKSQSAVVSCAIVMGAALVFAWVYVFGLADDQQ